MAEETRVEMGARILSEGIADQGVDIDNLGDGESIVFMQSVNTVALNLNEFWDFLEKRLEEEGYEILPIDGGRP